MKREYQTGTQSRQVYKNSRYERIDILGVFFKKYDSVNVCYEPYFKVESGTEILDQHGSVSVFPYHVATREGRC